jgi:hypothetical protein
MMDTHEEDFFSLIRRSRPGFQSVWAMIDLLGVARLSIKNRREALERLNDLQGGVFDGLIDFFPGGDEYRICYGGDSVFVVEEIDPDSDWRAVMAAALWSHVRPLVLGESSRHHNWQRRPSQFRIVWAASSDSRTGRSSQEGRSSELVVLTGASMAFAKCCEAERQGFRWWIHRTAVLAPTPRR